MDSMAAAGVNFFAFGGANARAFVRKHRKPAGCLARIIYECARRGLADA